MAKQNQPKQYERPKFISDKELIENIEHNIREAEVSMEFALPEEYENIKDKNERRRHEIQRIKEEPLT